MARGQQGPLKWPTIFPVLRTAMIFCIIVGSGALCGVALIMLLYGGNPPQEKMAGCLLLAAGACVAAPGNMILCRLGGGAERGLGRRPEEVPADGGETAPSSVGHE